MRRMPSRRRSATLPEQPLRVQSDAPQLLEDALVRLLAVLLAAMPILAQESLYYSRTFPNSVPEYFDVAVTREGEAIYREALDDEFPVEFQVDEETTENLFNWALALEGKEDAVQSPIKTAFTGDKVIRWTGQDGKVRSESKFVFSQVPEAQSISTWFLNVATTARHLIELERVAQFDRLGVNKALLHLQSSMNRGKIVAPEQLLPILKKIVATKQILHLARTRASAMVEAIESGTFGPQAEEEPKP